MIETNNLKSFKKLKEDKLLFVSSPTCETSKMIIGRVTEFAEDNLITILEIDGSSSENDIGEYDIQVFPTILYFKDGEPPISLGGYQSNEALRKLIE